jgi:hypothetical protein
MQDTNEDVGSIYVRVDEVLCAISATRPDILPNDSLKQDTGLLSNKTVDAVNSSTGAKASVNNVTGRGNECVHWLKCSHWDTIIERGSLLPMQYSCCDGISRPGLE